MSSESKSCAFYGLGFEENLYKLLKWDYVVFGSNVWYLVDES